MKLIVQYDEDGTLYVYAETEAHFKRADSTRPDYPRITLEQLAHECCVQPGSLVIVDIKKKQGVK